MASEIIGNVVFRLSMCIVNVSLVFLLFKSKFQVIMSKFPDRYLKHFSSQLKRLRKEVETKKITLISKLLN